MSIFSFFNSNGQVKAPDFAYPQTVKGDAEKALKEANSRGDAHGALQALIQIYVANQLVDPSQFQASIELVEKEAERYADSDLQSIYKALLGKMYANAYLSDSWKYDRRSLPLSPRPDSIDEWSGAQFKQKINELAFNSLRDPEKLGSLKITDYQDIITANELTATYYPTLLDFACQNAIDLLGVADADESELLDVANIGMNHTRIDTAPRMTWILQKWEHSTEGWAQTNGNDMLLTTRWTPFSEDKQKLLMLKKLFNATSNCQYASLLLCKIYETANFSEEPYYDIIEEEAQDDGKPETVSKAWLARTTEQFLAKFPSAPLANKLKSLLQGILAQSATISAPSLCYPGQKIELSIWSTNAPKVLVDVYRVPASISDKPGFNINQKAWISECGAPMRSFALTFDSEAPFREEQKQPIAFSDPGYYIFKITIPGKVGTGTSRTYTRCIEASPIAINGLDKPYVVIADPAQGAPIANAQVCRIKDNNPYGLSATTDKNGIAELGLLNSNGRWSCRGLSVKTHGKTYYYTDIASNNFVEGAPSESGNVTILTDRGIYHPGDTVSVLAIAEAYTSQGNGKISGQRLVEGKRAIIKFLNANYQEVGSAEATTDTFGRATATFAIPTDGLTGYFQLQAFIDGEHWTRGNARVMVSDYKMPDFEVSITSTARNVPAEGSVTISGKAVYYSGMPVASASIDVLLKSASFWRFWGGGEELASKQIATDAEGCFSVTFTPDDFAKADNSYFFMAAFEASSPSGTTAQASTAFSLGKQYSILVSIANSNVNALQPFKPKVEVIDPEGRSANLPLKWTLKKGDEIVADGDFSGSIDFGKTASGEYKFAVATVDETLADAYTTAITIYNPNTKDVPGDNLVFLPSNKQTVVPGSPVEVFLGITAEKAWIYYVVSDFTTLREIKAIALTQGYHKIKVNVPDDFEGGRIDFIGVQDCQASIQALNLNVEKPTGLTIVGESFRDKLVPGQAENWKFRIVDPDGKPVEAALALDMYNAALNTLVPNNFALRFTQSRSYSQISVDNLRCYLSSGSFDEKLKQIKYDDLQWPEFNFYGQPVVGGRMRMYSLSKSNIVNYSLASSSDMIYTEEAEMDAEAPMGSIMADAGDSAYGARAPEEETGQPGNGSEAVDFRDADVPMAIWAPTLATDAEGNVCYSFTVPNANTTWALKAVAWTRDMEVGHLMREFVASKPVMVAPNAPRFLRAGDEAVIVANVLNNTDSISEITTTIEFFDPLSGSTINRTTDVATIEAQGHKAVAATLKASGDYAAIGFRVWATNGQFSDGEQQAIPVLPSVAQLVETTPFYLNPGEKRWEMVLPSAPDARISLTFCENPAWSIVSALPGLRQDIGDYANSAAAAIFSAAVANGIMADNPNIAKALKEWTDNPSETALTSMLEKNEDLKIALLNSTPWVQAAQSDTERMARLALIFDRKETARAIDKAIGVLQKLQRNDGGWAWGSWCDESSVWVTSNVLGMMAELKTMGWLPTDKKLANMIDQALDYYDKHVDAKYPDLIYAITRPQFNDKAISLNGQKVISKTVNKVLKDWKKYADPAYKAMAAEALYLNDYQSMAKQVLKSISEFGIWTKQQGLTFPSVNALYDYAILLEAYAMVEPQSKEVDGLRQQLIVRKQATDWGTAVVTTEVVASILSPGSCWTVPEQGATITAGGTPIQPEGAIEKATGSLRANLSQHAGQELTIFTSGAGPAYGAVFAQFSQEMDDVKAASCDDLSIEKIMMVRRGTEWEMATDSLNAGDRVKVQLTIRSKRNLQYVSIIDERPAAFEPAEQLPGWIWSEGVGFYRENRDATTTMHVVYMSPGVYLLTYEMNVVRAGRYSSGVASIQSQYAPEIAAHSAGQKISVAQ